MSAGERVFIVLAGLTAAAGWFLIQYRAQAPASPGCRRDTCKSPRASLTRRGLWVWPDPDPTAGQGPATNRKETR